MHETRAGEHWPLREEDITCSKTIKLDEKQWFALYDCLEGGIVTSRTKKDTTGSSGPDLYLYWSNDHGKYQAFTFESEEKLQSFIQLCTSLKQE